MSTNEFVWHPEPELSRASIAAAFMRGLGVSDFAALVRCRDTEPAPGVGSDPTMMLTCAERRDFWSWR
jgi:hypothetical protein